MIIIENKSTNPKKADFQEYKRLQEKLLFLETRIVEMKNHFETAQKTCSSENKPVLEKEGKSSKPPNSLLETPKAFTYLKSWKRRIFL